MEGEPTVELDNLIEEAEARPEVAPAVEVKAEETVEKSTEPVVLELKTSESSPNLAPARSKEEIAAAMQEKLSRKTDDAGADPFVPSVQLDNEVKEVANKKGFPLSRGTEIGARLMARSKRVV